MNLGDSMIKLLQGDCLERMKEIESGSADMVLTDPPYGTTACKWDSIIPLEPMWEQLKRVIKPNGAIVMTASQPFTATLIASNMKMFKYCWVWEKDNGKGHLNAKKQPLRAHEDIVVFYGKQPVYFPQMVEAIRPSNKSSKKKKDSIAKVYGKFQEYERGGSMLRYPRSVQKINTVNHGERVEHPTQKPVALMEYMIKTYTNEGDTVLDFAMGSGTSMVAAKNLNRYGIGIELDEAYFRIAQDRIEAA